jgi:hypothetical protein
LYTVLGEREQVRVDWSLEDALEQPAAEAREAEHAAAEGFPKAAPEA